MSSFKYYHGTSTIFLDSIRTKGLGAINPNFDLKNLEVLAYLFDIAELHLIGIPKYETWRKSILASVKQTHLEIHHDDGRIQKMNYRHDGMYISLSRARAAIYACFNKYGSEILEACLMLIELFTVYGISYKIPKEIDLFGVENYIGANPKPIMVEILEIQDSDLEKEDGKTASEALNFLRAILPTLTEKQRFEFLQSCNYKTLVPVPPEKLRFYEIEFEGHPSHNNFEFTLSKI